MSGRFRPYRRMRNEVCSLALAALVPFVLVAVFPLAALRPLPAVPRAGSEASCAFVTLTPAEERSALVAARAAWQIDRENPRSVRIDLFADALPSYPPRAVLGKMPDFSVDGRAPEPYTPDPLPPTLAAPTPARIAPQPDADATPPTFSREELLKID